jgi:peptide/nickel transport system permease protein
MAVYLLKRGAMALATVACITLFLALVVHLVPGDPARVILGQHATPALIAQVDEQLGLNKPIAAQLWAFMSGAAHGDFGTDIVSQVPVSHLLVQALPDTAILTLVSVILTVAVGVPLGIFAASRPNSLLDRALGGFSIVCLSGYSFVVGLALLLIFCVQLQWLPAIGAGDLSDPVGYAEHLILPAIALAVVWWGYISRLVRASLLEVLGSAYIRTARAFGFREGLVFYKYALKNALVPVVGMMGLIVGYTLAGTVFVEEIFNRPGLGSLALQAVSDRNWPVIRATVLVYAVGFIAANLLADLSYRLIDPRIRVEQGLEAAT